MEEGYSAESMLEKLVKERRAALVRVAGEERYIAAEDAGLYRDALGVPPPGRPARQLPGARRGPDGRPGPPLRRHPRPLPHPPARRPLRRRSPAGAARARARGRRWSAGSCCPAAPSASGATPTSCGGCAAPASPGCARRSRPRTAASSPASCRAGRTSTPTAPPGAGPDRLREALVPLQGVALTPKTWERDVLPAPARLLQPGLARRALHQRRARLDRRRRARPQRRPGRPLLPRGRAPGRARPRQRQARPARGRGPRRDPRAPRPGALLLARPARPRGQRPRSCTRRSGTWPGSGEATNDAFAPLRAPRLRAAQRSEPRRPPLLQPPRRRRRARCWAAGR